MEHMLDLNRAAAPAVVLGERVSDRDGDYTLLMLDKISRVEVAQTAGVTEQVTVHNSRGDALGLSGRKAGQFMRQFANYVAVDDTGRELMNQLTGKKETL